MRDQQHAGGEAMNRKIPFMMAVALLLGAATLPGVSVPPAAAEQHTQVTPAMGVAPTLSDEFFRVEWTVSPGRHGDSRIIGYIYNQYQEPAEHVQLRLSEVDASGDVVSNVTRPVFGTVPALDRSYFDVQAPAHFGVGPRYQVAVQSFDFLEGRGR
jgi:hypothetical protein